MSTGEEDRQAFTWKLLCQTVSVWAGTGVFSAMAVASDGCGLPIMMGIFTTVLGLLAVGGLAVAGPADRWYLLRWVNGFLNGAFVVAPGVTGIVVRVLLMVFGVATIDGPLEPGQSRLLQVAVMMGIIVGAAIRLAGMWGKVRHADLPTDEPK